MKIRLAHVTNSSSSSFLVAFPEEQPDTPEKMQKLLFGEQELLYQTFEDEPWPTEELARAVLESRQTVKTIPLEVEAVVAMLVTGYGSWNHLAEDLTQGMSLDEKCKSWQAITDFEADKVARAFIEQVLRRFPKTKELEVYEFADETPLGSALEYSSVFSTLPHITISHH